MFNCNVSVCYLHIIKLLGDRSIQNTSYSNYDYDADHYELAKVISININTRLYEVKKYKKFAI